jgi:hypothetical protein
MVANVTKTDIPADDVEQYIDDLIASTRMVTPFTPVNQECSYLPGSKTGKVTRSGPCSEWAQFKTCDLPFNHTEVAILFTATANNDPFVALPQQRIAFNVGIQDAANTGVTNSNTGLEVFGPFTLANTTLGNTNALSPDEDIVYKIYGMTVGVEDPILEIPVEGDDSIMQYGTPNLQEYENYFLRAVLQQTFVIIRHGVMNYDEWLGKLGLWRPSRNGALNDNLPEAASYTAFRCADLSGASQDADRLFMEVTFPKEVRIANNPASPSVAGQAVRVPILLSVYGVMECRDKKGFCQRPTWLQQKVLEVQASQNTKAIQNQNATIAAQAQRIADLEAQVKRGG